MFERYTEKAQRVIFFARYESSAFGSSWIEPEFLLLGLMRENLLLFRTAKGDERLSVSEFRNRLERRLPPRPTSSTSVDLPLSNSSKRILAYAAEEAEELGHRHIGTDHLLLGILCEEECFAAEFLRSQGVRALAVREEARRSGSAEVVPQKGSMTSAQNILTPITNPMFTPASLHAIAFALEEAQAFQQDHITPDHLLLGLLRLQNSTLPALLEEHGVTARLLRTQIVKTEPDAPPTQAPEEKRPE